jgi:hypothetical protein
MKLFLGTRHLLNQHSPVYTPVPHVYSACLRQLAGLSSFFDEPCAVALRISFRHHEAPQAPKNLCFPLQVWCSADIAFRCDPSTRNIDMFPSYIPRETQRKTVRWILGDHRGVRLQVQSVQKQENITKSQKQRESTKAIHNTRARHAHIHSVKQSII